MNNRANSSEEYASVFDLVRADLESFELWQVEQRNELSAVSRALANPQLADRVYSLSVECVFRGIRAAVPNDFDWWFEMSKEGESRVIFRHNDAARDDLHEVSDYDATLIVALLERYPWREARNAVLLPVERIVPMGRSEDIFERIRAQIHQKRTDAASNLSSVRSALR